MVVTSTIRTHEENKAIGSVSRTHVEGRAADIRSRNFDNIAIKEFIKFFNHKYEDIAAISRSDGKPRLVVYHDSGNGSHFHVQTFQ